MSDDDLLVTQKAITFGPDGDVLLVRTKSAYPWVPPGGRVKEGEDADAALVREMHEETGLNVTVKRPVQTMTDAWITDDGEPMFTVVYRCETDERAVSLNHEHEDFAWFSPGKAASAVALDSLETAIERAQADRTAAAGAGRFEEPSN